MTALLRPKDERRALDAYMTPPALADALVNALLEVTFPRLVAAREWCEPSVGDGAFARALTRAAGGDLGWTVDVDPACDPNQVCTFQHFAKHTALRFDLVMGNPPFNEWEEFVEAGLRVVKPLGYVAFLLRLSALGGQKRAAEFWPKYPLAHLIPITPRPSFTADGKTDASEYGLLVWRKGSRAIGRVHAPLVWKQQNTEGR